MPFKLHPSGFCTWFNYSTSNLLRGEPCAFCNRVAGHSINCVNFIYDETNGKSSRPKLFNAASILWAKEAKKNFVTFTLPSMASEISNRFNGTYQRDADCPDTGDLRLAEKFSKTLEAWKKRVTRSGGTFSYVWVAEAQMKRKKKYGGIGDLHFHLVVNQQIKNDHGRVTDLETLQWLTSIWCSHIGATSKNCIHVDPLPDRANSIPAYLSKYLGKGSQRMVLSRKFNCSRDLSRFKPITLSCLPDATLIRQNAYTTPGGYEVCTNYFNTSEVLELYGGAMLEEFEVGGSRTDKNFTQDAIIERQIRRATVRMGSSYPT